jgi:hypothetical protein
MLFTDIDHPQQLMQTQLLAKVDGKIDKTILQQIMQPNARKDFFYIWILILLLFSPAFFSRKVQSCCFFHFLPLSLVKYQKSPSTFMILWLLFMVIMVLSVLAASIPPASIGS